MKLAITIFMCCALANATHTCTKCYIAANGSDSNTGASPSQAWQHAPFMPNCASVCATQVPAPGDSYVFRGSDTWNFGNSTIPAVGVCGSVGRSAACWTWNVAGLSAAPIYIGVDQTFFNGPSWARPIMSGDNPITTAFPASCAAKDFTNFFFLWIDSVSYVTVDDLEWSGACTAQTSTSASGGTEGYVIDYENTHTIFSNNYFHGITATAASADAWASIVGNDSGVGTPNNFDQFVGNVFDNSDGSQGAANSAACAGGTTPQSPCASGQGIYGAAYDVHQNVFNHLVNFIVANNCDTVHDNTFTNLMNTWVASPNNTHPNVLNCDGSATSTNDFSFYNNPVAHNNVPELIYLFCNVGHNCYFFNNTFFDNLEYTPGTGAPSNCVGWYQSSSSGTATGYVVNNTFDFSIAGCQMNAAGLNIPNQAWNGGTIHFQNNHIIGYATNPICAGGASTCTTGVTNGLTFLSAGATVSFHDDGSEITQTEAAANAQGYLATNFYAPTLPTNSTIAAGTNLTSFCPTFSSDSALCSGTSRGVLEQNNQAIYPAIKINPRSSIDWDAGAYEFFGLGDQITIGNKVSAGNAIR